MEVTDYDDESITVTATGSDSQSGIASYYFYYWVVGEATPNLAMAVDTEESEYTITLSGLEDNTTYFLCVVAIDGVGYTTLSSTITCFTQSTDLLDYLGYAVQYPVDLDSDGDTTDDWLLWYVDEDDIYLISTTCIPHEDGTSQWIDWDSTCLEPSPSSTKESALMDVFWGSGYPTLSWTSLMTNSTVGVNSNKTGTNELFMFEFSYTSSTTYSNAKTVTSLLNTSYWDQLVNTSYVDYAIGGSTVEMWVKVLEEKGYETLYLSSGTYGYSIKSDSTSTTYYFDLSDSGALDDPLLYPPSSDDYGITYWLASPGYIDYTRQVSTYESRDLDDVAELRYSSWHQTSYTPKGPAYHWF